MKKQVLVFALLLVAWIARAQHFEVDTISLTGRADQRINLVFLSDGYQQSQLGKFINDVQWITGILFARTPYSNYRNYFNLFAIKVPSGVSGAANHPDTLINNYFGSTFNYAGIQRLVVPTRTDRINRVLADNFPSYDQVVMVVNDARYGGSGGWIATTTVNSNSPEICIHELGHSFAGLSDEYWAGPAYARENVNMTQESDTSKVSWNRWLGFHFTGIFPHSESPTWFRPHQNCEMRYLNSNFCPVCTEQIISKILEMTSPILGYSPENVNPDLVSDSTFKVSLLAPDPNTLKIWWELNTLKIESQKDSILLPARVLLPGENDLSCYILDTTSLIRNSTHPVIHLNKVTWKINYKSTRTDFVAFTDKISLSVYPNPASENITLSVKSERPAGMELTVCLFDSSGKPVTRRLPVKVKGTGESLIIPLSGHHLAEGLYFLQAESTGHLFKIPIVIIQ